MIDHPETCPSCRSSKYSNPQLKLMVNTCGHSLCENCVEVLFVRGSGLCVQCKTPIRKVNFRYQLFEDPFVQKEVDLRKKILIDFNQREDDFPSREEYDLYLEKIEEIIYNLLNNIDVEETKRHIENYKRKHKDVIKRNRLKPSASMLFYESELEREASVREKFEREDEMKRNALLQVTNTEIKKDNDDVSSSSPRSMASSFSTGTMSQPMTAMKLPPPSSSSRPLTRYPFAPPSAVQQQQHFGGHTFVPPPPSAVSSGVGAIQFATPASILSNYNSLSTASNWTAGTHHQVLLLPPKTTAQQPREPDTLVLPPRSQLTLAGSRLPSASSFGFTYQPYEPELCGPSYPKDGHTRWSEILQVYTDCVIDPYQTRKRQIESIYSPVVKMEKLEDLELAFKTEEPEQKPHIPRIVVDGVEDMKPVAKGDLKPNLGSASLLSDGACGISPFVFLQRCLQESRCGLYL